MAVDRIDAHQLIERFKDIEKRKFPNILVRSLNDSAFDVRQHLTDKLPSIFDRPVPLTLRSILVRKASLEQEAPTAEVFLRDEASKGVPPSKYLRAEIFGGPRRAKRSEVLLQREGILGSNERWVLGRGAREDASGNLPGGIVTAVLSDLGAQFDPLQNSKPESRRKRKVRNRKKAGSGVYFYNRAKRGRLVRGIYERKTRGFLGPSKGGQGGVNLIMAIVGTTNYQKRFDFFGMARERFYRIFPENFRLQMLKFFGHD